MDWQRNGNLLSLHRSILIVEQVSIQVHILNAIAFHMIGIVICIHSLIGTGALSSHFPWQLGSLVQPILLNEHLALVHILSNLGKHLLILYSVNIKELFFSSIIRIKMLISINKIPGSHWPIISMRQLWAAFQIVEMPCIVPFLVQWMCPITTLCVVFFQIP